MVKGFEQLPWDPSRPRFFFAPLKGKPIQRSRYFCLDRLIVSLLEKLQRGLSDKLVVANRGIL